MKKAFLFCCLLLASCLLRAQCNAQFTYSNAPLNNSLLRVTFTTAVSSIQLPNTAVYYAMSFGNGQTVLGPVSNFAVNYTAPGTYVARFIMTERDSTTNNIICTDTVVHNVTVAYPPCGATVSVSSGAAGVVTFTASNPANTVGLVYNWNFGDGTNGTGNPVTHTYAVPGTYTYTLTDTSGSPCTYTNTGTVIAHPALLNCSQLHSQFSVTMSGSTALLTNTSPVLGSPYMTYQYWSFGDGSFGNGSTTSHTYTSYGNYTIRLYSQYSDSSYFTSCSDSVAHTVVVANPNFIGVIHTDLQPGTDTMKVWLIHNDTATNMLAAMDSTIVSGDTTVLYRFYNVIPGDYLVKAARINQPAGMPGLLPTYRDSSLYWVSAHVVSLTGAFTYGNDIWMQQGIATAGPGFIGGNISLGPNQGNGAGVPGMQVFLRDATGRALTVSYTDGAGDFAFGSLPDGTYSVYPEALNYATTPYSNITLAAGQETATGINFVRDDTMMNIKPRAAGISYAPAGRQLVSVYPNPATGYITVCWKAGDMEQGKLTVSSLTGQEVLRADLSDAAGPCRTLQVRDLKPGIYLIHIYSSKISSTRKLIIQP